MSTSMMISFLALSDSFKKGSRHINILGTTSWGLAVISLSQLAKIQTYSWVEHGKRQHPMDLVSFVYFTYLLFRQQGDIANIWVSFMGSNKLNSVPVPSMKTCIRKLVRHKLMGVMAALLGVLVFADAPDNAHVTVIF